MDLSGLGQGHWQTVLNRSSIKCGEILDQLKNYPILEKHSAYQRRLASYLISQISELFYSSTIFLRISFPYLPSYVEVCYVFSCSHRTLYWTLCTKGNSPSVSRKVVNMLNKYPSNATLINLLKTKLNLLYIRNESLPRSKHLPPRL